VGQHGTESTPFADSKLLNKKADRIYPNQLRERDGTEFESFYKES
jgi:hypothetical protein